MADDEKDKRKRPGLDVVWHEARQLISARRGRLALGLGLMVVSRLSGLVLPATSKILIDEVIGKSRHELLGWLALAAAAATAVQAATSWANSQLLGITAQRAITDLRKSVQRHVLALPVSYFDSTKSGILISRVMNDAEGIRNLVGTGLVQLTGGLLTATLAMAVLFWLNWRLTLLTWLVLLGFGGLLAFSFTRLRPLFRQRGEIHAQVTGRLAESFGGVRVVKAYTAEGRESLVFARGAHRLFRNVAKSIVSISALTSATSLLFGTMGFVMLMVGGRAIIADTMTIGDFVMYIAFTGMMVSPLIQIASIGTQITEAFAGLDRIREIREVAAETADDPSRQPVIEIGGEVEFADVSFEYDPGVPVLRHVSFRAAPGSTTALVGSSGSGKSTLIGLVAAFNHPQSGTIRIDGRDLETLRLRDYRGHLGIVLQDNFLFDGTVGENIAYSRPGASQKDIEAVARIAHVDEFVEHFENRYDTIVGERGVKLSGGQRQRVAIARAILADPKILILDEATSSLDSESEALIQDGLRSLRRGRTTFVIAHRLSTVRTADQILVIESGEIVERGNHDGLLAQGGRYRDLYDRQYSLETDRFINPGEDFTPESEAEAEAEAEAVKLPAGPEGRGVLGS